MSSARPGTRSMRCGSRSKPTCRSVSCASRGRNCANAPSRPWPPSARRWGRATRPQCSRRCRPPRGSRRFRWRAVGRPIPRCSTRMPGHEPGTGRQRARRRAGGMQRRSGHRLLSRWVLQHLRGRRRLSHRLLGADPGIPRIQRLARKRPDDAAAGIRLSGPPARPALVPVRTPLAGSGASRLRASRDARGDPPTDTGTRSAGPASCARRRRDALTVMQLQQSAKGVRISSGAMNAQPPVFRRLRLFAASLITLVLAGCCPGEAVDERGWPKELVLGLVPALEADALVDNLDPLADYLETELGVPVTSFVPQDYTGLVEALGAGRADIGMLPPFAAMLGQRRYDLEPILISTRKGETGYRTQWMTNDPSVCESPPVAVERICESRVAGRQDIVRTFLQCEGDLEQVRDETVAFVDPNSTSGFLFPAVQLMDMGIDPERDVNGLFVGGHDAAVLAVYAGDTRFGVAYEDARNMICDQYPDIGEKAIVFDYAPMIPNDGVQLRPGLPDDLKEAIIRAFLKLTEEQAQLPDDEKILWVLYEIDGFQRFEPGMYDPVRSAYEIIRQ